MWIFSQCEFRKRKFMSGFVFATMGTIISGRLPTGYVLLFPQTVVGAGYRKVRVM